jgi:hypothetical protein
MLFTLEKFVAEYTMLCEVIFRVCLSMCGKLALQNKMVAWKVA